MICKYKSHIFFIFFLALFPFIQSKLTPNYYEKSCPRFLDIMEETVAAKQQLTPTTAGATLRLFFHDCMIGGCDASVLISSNAFNKGERDADINLSLSGDGFDVVTRAKNMLELECPGIVSCSDIIATAARDLVVLVGGPFYELGLGRKDSLVSRAVDAENKYPTPNMTMNQVIEIFTSKGFTIQEMVALVGAHTIGFSHCKEFSNRLYNFSKTAETDPKYKPEFAAGLKKLCQNYQKDPAMSAYNDVMTPKKFDNMYYKNVKRGLGLLATDSLMFEDKRTKPFVELYAENESKFFEDFGHAMRKVSVLNVKVGKNGEVRNRCDSFNNLDTN
ncbi:peroxidase 31-like [Vicia villosa]|uniref:peroxidase 31-like n=1 Tax=Vicia villosa TaxID=3911 RepID=UPI00273AF8C4|nr:peroxidase 31-like [Vicia villosa]